MHQYTAFVHLFPYIVLHNPAFPDIVIIISMKSNVVSQVLSFVVMKDVFFVFELVLFIHYFQITGAEFDQKLPLPPRHQHPGAKAATQWDKFVCHQVSCA